LLKAVNIRAGYDKSEVLHGITIEVAEREIVALVGPNGAGKSTTIRCLTGETPLTEGEIVFEGERLDGLAPYEIAGRGLACSPEGRQVFGNLTVGENLRLGAFLLRDRGVLKERLDRVFSLFPRLAERRKQYAESLSGGEQQMLAIGRAVMAAPRLLLLDEPSLGIAPVIVDSIYEKIAEISRQGASVLIVEQNIGLALEISHRTYVMESGEIHLSGPSADLLHNPYILDTYLGVK
jgi:branched-chain amino acid transport system ATP-binding protein